MSFGIPEACLEPMQLGKVLLAVALYSALEYRLGKTKAGSALGLLGLGVVLVLAIVMERFRRKNVD